MVRDNSDRIDVEKRPFGSNEHNTRTGNKPCALRKYVAFIPFKFVENREADSLLGKNRGEVRVDAPSTWRAVDDGRRSEREQRGA